MVVRTLEVLALWVFGFDYAKLPVEMREDCFEAFGESIEVFAVELNSEYSLVIWYKGLEFAWFTLGQMHKVLRNGGYIISVVLSEEHLWLIRYSTQKWILLDHIQVILNGLNAIDSLQFLYLSTEILRKKLMAEASPNEFEFFIELISSNDVF